jgi:hypothetical protein
MPYMQSQNRTQISNLQAVRCAWVFTHRLPREEEEKQEEEEEEEEEEEDLRISDKQT